MPNDKQRLDWVFKNQKDNALSFYGPTYPNDGWTMPCFAGRFKTLRQAIDAAMRQEKKKCQHCH